MLNSTIKWCLKRSFNNTISHYWIKDKWFSLQLGSAQKLSSLKEAKIAASNFDAVNKDAIPILVILKKGAWVEADAEEIQQQLTVEEHEEKLGGNAINFITEWPDYDGLLYCDYNDF